MPLDEGDISGLKAAPGLCDCLSSVVYGGPRFGTDPVKEA